MQCPLFRGLKEDQIEQLLGSGDNYTVSKHCAGEVIAKRDTAYSGLMIIVAGAASGEMTDSSGSKIKIDSIEAPQLIAPAFLFGGYNRLPVDVIADTDVEILTLHRGLIFELMQENVLILSNFIDIISNRANVWSKKIYFLSFKSLKEKAASYLLEQTLHGERIPIPDIAGIAEIFSATRRSLVAVLEDMQKRGLIRIEESSIKILNRAALQRIIS